MKNLQNEKSFGFTYEHEGHEYLMHIQAETEEEAVSRLADVSKARLLGELRHVDSN